MEYTHLPLNEEVFFLAGSYWIEREERLPYKGEEVLYLIGRTSTITACCGSCPPFNFIKVVGKIKKWRFKEDERGYPVSQIEPITDKSEQEEIREALRVHNIIRIEFW